MRATIFILLLFFFQGCESIPTEFLEDPRKDSATGEWSSEWLVYGDKLETGGGDITEGAKEQFNDGTNTLAVAPGKVIAYTRNKVTNKVLEDSDVEVIRIDGNELVRGRGGPRCMILPLTRK